MLQAEADAKGETLDNAGRGPLEDRAAALLVDDALNRMRQWVVPMMHFDGTLADSGVGALPFGDFPDDGTKDALSGLLGEDARYITDFLTEGSTMSGVHAAFWQG